MFRFTVEVCEPALELPRLNDGWIMLAFVELGFTEEELIGLNRARCHQQVLYISDVFDASGRALDRKYLARQQEGEVWSTLLFPLEKPSARDFRLWMSALYLLAPRGRPTHRIGQFIKKGHKIWSWRYDPGAGRLYHIRGASMEVYAPTAGDGEERRPNSWMCTMVNQPRSETGMLCTVQDLTGTDKAVVCYAEDAPTTPLPSTFWEVLLKWQREWIWENLQWIGEDWWIVSSIEDGSCMAVTDGSYMRDLYPQIHSAALVIKCTKGRGRLWCSFTEDSEAACSYRGELMGLMAIHLIFLAVNEVTPGLKGEVHIFSDCLGALEKVKNLPPTRIPMNLAHSDILKNILVNCSRLSFDRIYSHVCAHQDNREDYGELSQPSQLNLIMDYNAKQAILGLGPSDTPCQQAFPLEPVCVYAGG
jgi:hypothetical protein